jgi:hypothetical protein
MYSTKYHTQHSHLVCPTESKHLELIKLTDNIEEYFVDDEDIPSLISFAVIHNKLDIYLPLLEKILDINNNIRKLMLGLTSEISNQHYHSYKLLYLKVVPLLTNVYPRQDVIEEVIAFFCHKLLVEIWEELNIESMTRESLMITCLANDSKLLYSATKHYPKLLIEEEIDHEWIVNQTEVPTHLLFEHLIFESRTDLCQVMLNKHKISITELNAVFYSQDPLKSFMFIDTDCKYLLSLGCEQKEGYVKLLNNILEKSTFNKVLLDYVLEKTGDTLSNVLRKSSKSKPDYQTTYHQLRMAFREQKWNTVQWMLSKLNNKERSNTFHYLRCCNKLSLLLAVDWIPEIDLTHFLKRSQYNLEMLEIILAKYLTTDLREVISILANNDFKCSIKLYEMYLLSQGVIIPSHLRIATFPTTKSMYEYINHH